MIEQITQALRDVFTSPNEVDRNLEVANVVDGLFFLSRSIDHLADAITNASSASVEEP